MGKEKEVMSRNSFNKVQHFLSLENLLVEELKNLLWNSYLLKQVGKNSVLVNGVAVDGNEVSPQKLPLSGRMLALLFTKSSTRTRLAFERSVMALGGRVIFLSSDNIQLSRGEPLSDTLRVLSGYLDGVVVRMGSHEALQEACAYSSVPVINALTDLFHPTEALADALTMAEILLKKQGEKDSVTAFANVFNTLGKNGKMPKACFIGDANNVSRSFALVCHLFGMQCSIATPEGKYFSHLPTILKNSETVQFIEDPIQAVKDANFVYTDTWVSMGSEESKAHQRKKLAIYAVNENLVRHAAKDYVFMHCLPAYRGEEVTAEIIDGKHSQVFTQSENRMHTIKALLYYLYK